jgi:hypothetical protein
VVLAIVISLPTYRRQATLFAWPDRKWHTRFVLNAQQRFFYGYRTPVPGV